MTAKDDILRARKKEEDKLYAVMEEDRIKDELEVEKRLGRKMSQQDSEYWQLAEKYRSRYWKEITEPRKALIVAADKAKDDDKVDPLSSITAGERFCEIDGCNNVIVPTGKRGRPAKKCESCREAKK